MAVAQSGTANQRRTSPGIGFPLTFCQWIRPTSFPTAGNYHQAWYYGTAVYSNFSGFGVTDDHNIGFFDNGFAGGAKASTDTVTLGDAYFVAVSISAGGAITFRWMHEDDVALTTEPGATFTGTQATNLLVVGSDPDNVSLVGEWAHMRVFTAVLSESEMFAEARSSYPVLAAWGAWPGDPQGTDLSGNGRTLTPSGTFTDVAPPALDGPPAPAVLASAADTTDYTDQFATVSVTPHAGSLVIIDALVSDDAATSAPDSVTGSSITGATLLDTVEVVSGSNRHRLARYAAEGTGAAGAITISQPGAAASMIGRIYCVRTYPAGYEAVASANASGTGTALAATLPTPAADAATDVAYALPVSTGTTTLESGYSQLGGTLQHNSPTARLVDAVRGTGDTSPTATHSASTPWGAVATEIGPAAGEAPSEGIGAGEVVITGTAVGNRASTGLAIGSVLQDGTGVGARTSTGAAVGSVTITGTAEGDAPGNGTGAGQVTITGTAVGARASTGAATGSVTITGTAVGDASDAPEGIGAGQVLITGTAVGFTGPEMVSGCLVEPIPNGCRPIRAIVGLDGRFGTCDAVPEIPETASDPDVALACD